MNEFVKINKSLSENIDELINLKLCSFAGLQNDTMTEKAREIIHDLKNLLQQDYRGVNLAVYAIATAGLAVSIHKIRPVSKFSKASKVPDHFIRNHEPLHGTFAGVQHTPVRLLINHQAPVYLPLWHSSKPPLPVKLWGVDVVSGNAINWLQCVARGHQVTLKPIARENDDLVSTVILHLKRPEDKTVEDLDIGKKLLELGFAKVSVPKIAEKDTFESKLVPLIVSAEHRAKSYRNGIWSDILPPLPGYVIYWRKGSQLFKEVSIVSLKKLLQLIAYFTTIALSGAKKLALLPFKSSKKQVQTTS